MTVQRTVEKNGGKPALTAQLSPFGYNRFTLRAAERAGVLVKIPMGNGKLVTNGWKVSDEVLAGTSE
jgi:hypothetical protein